MGKGIKKLGKAVVGVVAKAPSTIVETTKDAGRALKGSGEAIIGKGDGNYLKNIGSAGADLLGAAANVGVTGASLGTTSLNKDKGNNLDSQIASIGGGGSVPVPTEEGIPTEVEDPYLKAELENSRRKGRASTMLGGGTDSVGGTSAKKSLLGSL